jgi:hypothetical protein
VKESELIARQAKQLEELRDEVIDLKITGFAERVSISFVSADRINDNLLRYSKVQLTTFQRILDELGQ